MFRVTSKIDYIENIKGLWLGLGLALRLGLGLGLVLGFSVSTPL